MTKQQPAEPARQRSVESSVSDDIARIIGQSRPDQSARSGQEADEESGSNAAQSQPMPVEPVETADAGANKTSPAPQPDSAEPSAAKELKKFDYDIIASTAPNPTQTNAENLLKSAQTHQSQMANQMMTQIDFVPQQQQQQQPAQSAHQVKVQPLTTNGQQPPVRLANERVPIYRSLFKTLKGGPGKLQVAQGAANQHHQLRQVGPHRYAVVSSRHRRDRSPLPDTANGSTSAASAKQAGQVQSHGVASYLQLLNSRYNLRLARVAPHVGPGAAPATASLP